MRNVVGVLALALVSNVAAAADKPDWAFPVTEKVQPAPRFEGTRSATSAARQHAVDHAGQGGRHVRHPELVSEPVPVDAEDRSIRQQGYPGARLRVVPSPERHGPR